ncbi:MAG: hypothetical protein ACOCVJ_03355, partial [Verrucomicrobiota bacterium]
MDDELQELKRQRALIQRHLDWLDRRIAAAEGGDASPAPSAQPPEPPPADPQPKTVSSDRNPVSTGITSPTDERVLQEALEAEKAESPGSLAGMDDLTKAKIGCLALFLIGT